MDKETKFLRLLTLVLYIIFGTIVFLIYQQLPYPVAWFLGVSIVGIYFVFIPLSIAERITRTLFKYRYCKNCYSRLPKDVFVCTTCNLVLEDLQLYDRKKILKMRSPNIKYNYRRLIFWIKRNNPDVDWKNMTKSEGDMKIKQIVDDISKTDVHRGLILGLQEYKNRYGYNSYFKDY